MGTEFAAAIGLAITNALGVVVPRSARTRDSALAPRIVEPARSPTDEESFEIGIDELRALGRFDLLPCVPSSMRGFPITDWWREVKRRWRDGLLDESAQRAIASNVSWLAEDLAGEHVVRSGMAALTDAELPEQILAQMRPGGIYTRGAVASLAEDPDLLDELLAPIGAIHDAVTHPAMTTRQRRINLMRALTWLSSTLDRISGDQDPDAWDRESRRLAAVDGFVHALTIAEHAGADVAPPRRPWRSETEPEAYAAGVATASRRLGTTVSALLPFKFAGDHATVEYCREEQRELPNDARLDELGWEIYLLARARGAEHRLAFHQAMDGNLAQRELVRSDFFARSPRSPGASTAASAATGETFRPYLSPPRRLRDGRIRHPHHPRSADERLS